ncbi:MAG: ABC transporter ATP-binding protein [Deltaproteobacteria bacterium]|jgi:inositol-phosphate transport system ATP-binding protein
MEIILEDFTKRFGDVTVIEKMNLKIREGEMLALLGPSGCGKSTTLFTICGIHRVDGGRVLFGEKDVSRVPAQQRNVGVVFQSYALYPHMSVFENIAFPLTVRKENKNTIRDKVDEIAELVHIGELLQRRPEQLSGGQQQRVALARALVRKPGILLLDEPLANLDAKLRLEMRSEIRRIQLETGISAVLVTHDQVEAMSMSDRIAIMKEGEILQVASPTEMYQQPVNDFVAGFLGNPPIAFLDAQIKDGKIDVLNGKIQFDFPRNTKPSNGTKIRLGIRPEHYQPNNPIQIPGNISFVETQGRENLYDVQLEDGSILRSIQSSAIGTIEKNSQVGWGVQPDQLLIFDQAGNCI